MELLRGQNGPNVSPTVRMGQERGSDAIQQMSMTVLNVMHSLFLCTRISRSISHSYILAYIWVGYKVDFPAVILFCVSNFLQIRYTSLASHLTVIYIEYAYLQNKTDKFMKSVQTDLILFYFFV